MVGADIAPSLPSRWRGDYGGKKQLWFPSNYVEEITSPSSLEPEQEVSMAMSGARRVHAPLACLLSPVLCPAHAQHHPAVLPSQLQLDENSPLGDLLGGVLDVPSCQIGECQGGSIAKAPWGFSAPQDTLCFLTYCFLGSICCLQWPEMGVSYCRVTG